MPRLRHPGRRRAPRAPPRRARRPSGGRSRRWRSRRIARFGESRPSLITASESESASSSSRSWLMTTIADPRAGEVDQRLVDRRRGAGVDPPGRLRHDQHLRHLQHLAAHDELLQVAARERPGRRAGAGRLHREGADHLLGVGARACPPRSPRAAPAPCARARSARRCRPARSPAPRRGRCAPPAPPRARSRRRSPMPSAPDRLAVEPDRRRRPRRLAGEREHQLVLPVAGDARRSRGSRRRGPRSGRPSAPRRSRPRPSRLRPSTANFSAPGARPSRLRDVLEAAADHHLGHRARGLLRRHAVAHHLAAAQDRRRVAERLDLVQLVADVEDRAAARRQRSAASRRAASPPAASGRSSARP